MVLRLSDAVIKRKGEVWTREARLFWSTSRGKHRQHCDAPPPSLALRQGGPGSKTGYWRSARTSWTGQKERALRPYRSQAPLAHPAGTGRA
jgi:hypothetical protein